MANNLQEPVAQGYLDKFMRVLADATGLPIGQSNPMAVRPTWQPADATPWSYAAASGGITNTTAVTIKAAAGAGKRNFLTALQYRNSAATASEIAIRDGAGGTVLWRGHVPASQTDQGNVFFDPPIRGSVNTLMEVVLLTTGTATRVNAQGYDGTQA